MVVSYSRSFVVDFSFVVVASPRYVISFNGMSSSPTLPDSDPLAP